MNKSLSECWHYIRKKCFEPKNNNHFSHRHDFEIYYIKRQDELIRNLQIKLNSSRALFFENNINKNLSLYINVCITFFIIFVNNLIVLMYRLKSISNK